MSGHDGVAVSGARVDGSVTLFVCGDVMTGRGVDQVLPHPSDTRLYEPVVRDATEYVELAERASGPIPAPVDFSYVWGDALEELERVGPDARIINLETAVTTSDDAWEGKGIHYRMHPENVPCLLAADVDCCVLANNHVLDWGRVGLEETLGVLDRAGLATAGAGVAGAGAGAAAAGAGVAAADARHDLAGAGAPAVLEGESGRVLVFAFGSTSSGIPSAWAARPGAPGVNLLGDLSPRTVQEIAGRVHRVREGGDVVVASIHWGPNWGYDIPPAQRSFAHGLVDDAGVDVVHGHSSHHPKGIEIYRGRPILYGCGDFLNDYEGISGHEQFRDDLVLMYFPTFDADERDLVRFELTPLKISRFRLQRPSAEERRWLRDTLDRESRKLGGTRVERGPDGTLRVRQDPSAAAEPR